MVIEILFNLAVVIKITVYVAMKEIQELYICVCVLALGCLCVCVRMYVNRFMYNRFSHTTFQYIKVYKLKEVNQ